MKTMISVAVMLAVAACIGCSGDPEIVPAPANVFPEMENTFTEDVSARKPYASPPSWILKPDGYPNKQPGCVYFAGFGLDRTTLQDARESAFEDAQRWVVRYMGTTVGVKTERTGEAVGDTRGGSYETMTDRIFSKTISENTVKNLRIRDQYYTAGLLVQSIVKRRVHRAYVLVEFGRNQAMSVAKHAKTETRKEIEVLKKKAETTPAKVLDERDASRLKSLEKLEMKLDNLSIDDFKL